MSYRMESFSVISSFVQQVVNEEVIIHGKHEEDNGSQKSVSREFTRRYKLPADVDPAKVTCTLSIGGVLCIRGPRKGDHAGSM